MISLDPSVHPRPSPETNQRPSLTPINLRFIKGVWETVHEKRLIKLFYDIKTAPGDERFLNLFGQQSPTAFTKLSLMGKGLGMIFTCDVKKGIICNSSNTF
ncbi:hypothetical protein NPIL_348401 [Nephila pilipes]|uniref:Uncharacterized protein n=1 Tax=Nephila pilipes TaxID=299642 RepID=A0A8X6P4V6_NEPPI|nr:hypothetical protein NPIL_348401 [Nephila pilipes]